MALLCQPTGDEGRPCRPTRVSVEVCETSLEEGCDVRKGVHDFFSEVDAYDDYVVELRGEEILEDPEELE